MKTFIVCNLEFHMNFTEMTFLSFKQIYVESSLDDTTKLPVTFTRWLPSNLLSTSGRKMLSFGRGAAIRSWDVVKMGWCLRWGGFSSSSLWETHSFFLKVPARNPTGLPVNPPPLQQLTPLLKPKWSCEKKTPNDQRKMSSDKHVPFV